MTIIGSLRDAVTAAGGTPNSQSKAGLLRQYVTALGGTPTQWDVIGPLRQAVTAAGGTPTQYAEVYLLRELLVALGAVPATYIAYKLYEQLATAGGGLTSLKQLSLSAATIAENSAAGTVVGAINGLTSGSTLSITDTAGTRFALSGTNIVAGATATNYESATSHTITLREVKAGFINTPRDTVITINVSNVFEAASLGVLAFSATSFTVGTATSGTITGATVGSTITASGLPTGVTIDGAARTWAYDGTGSAGSPSFTLTETLADSANSPRLTNISLTIAAASGASPSYIGPQLTAQASATTYPPRPLLTTNAYHPVGAKLRVRAAATYANLIAGTSLLVDDASFTLTANPTTNQNGLWAVLAGISSGKTFIDVRVEESSTVFSERSVAIMHGSSSVPAPQASIDFSVYSTFPLSGAITFAEPVYLEILGDDQISLQLSGAQPGTSFTLQWLDNGTKTYTGYDDFNVDHIYDYILRRRSLADVTANSTGAVTLLDYDTLPDAFSFTPVTGATTSALVPVTSTALTGMAAGYGAPLTLSGPWEKFNIDSGSGFGADLTSTSGVTIQDGWPLRVYVRASASYLTLARAIVTVGGVSANADVTTMADPTAASLAPASPATFHNQFAFSGGSSIALGTITFGAGYPTVVLADGAQRGHTGVSFGGVAGSVKSNPGNGVSVWQASAPVAAGTALAVVATFDNAVASVLAHFFTGVSTVSVVGGSLQSNTRGYGHDHNSDGTFSEGTGATMTVATGNVGLMIAFLTTNATVTWHNATGFALTTEPNGTASDNLMTAAVTSTGIPYVDFNVTGDYPYSCYSALVWSKT